jgi:hypothetical protein
VARARKFKPDQDDDDDDDDGGEQGAITGGGWQRRLSHRSRERRRQRDEEDSAPSSYADHTFGDQLSLCARVCRSWLAVVLRVADRAVVTAPRAPPILCTRQPAVSLAACDGGALKALWLRAPPSFVVLPPPQPQPSSTPSTSDGQPPPAKKEDDKKNKAEDEAAAAATVAEAAAAAAERVLRGLRVLKVDDPRLFGHGMVGLRSGLSVLPFKLEQLVHLCLLNMPTAPAPATTTATTKTNPTTPPTAPLFSLANFPSLRSLELSRAPGWNAPFQFATDVDSFKPMQLTRLVARGGLEDGGGGCVGGVVGVGSIGSSSAIAEEPFVVSFRSLMALGPTLRSLHIESPHQVGAGGGSSESGGGGGGAHNEATRAAAAACALGALWALTSLSTDAASNRFVLLPQCIASLNPSLRRLAVVLGTLPPPTALRGPSQKKGQQQQQQEQPQPPPIVLPALVVRLTALTSLSVRGLGRVDPGPGLIGLTGLEELVFESADPGALVLRPDQLAPLRSLRRLVLSGGAWSLARALDPSQVPLPQLETLVVTNGKATRGSAAGGGEKQPFPLEGRLWRAVLRRLELRPRGGRALRFGLAHGMDDGERPWLVADRERVHMRG